jgi:DNA polymerase
VVNLFIDIETRSEVDLRKSGQYVYADDPSTEILIVAWAIDDGPVKCWIPFFGEPMPLDLEIGLSGEPRPRLIAHNASFERMLISSQAGRKIGMPDLSDVALWDCTAARAACIGLPRTLDGASAALGLAEEKDSVGHKLMMKMSKPRKPRKSELADLMPGAVLWHELPEEMSRFAEYCMQDVTVERAIFRVLPPLSADERRVWELTETMNDRGVPVDVPLLDRMLVLIADAEETLNATISARTGGAVPRVSDHMALTRWLIAQGIDDAAETGVAKAAVAAMIENPEIDGTIREVLIIRQQGGGVSPKKWRAIKARISADGCIHGALIYCGAASTGRWSSRGVQLHNLPRGGSLKNALQALTDILDGATAAEIDMVHGPTLVVASELLRPAFIATPGHLMVRGDYSQIEARVCPWLFGAEWKLDAFRAYDTITGWTEKDGHQVPVRAGPDIYLVSATGMARIMGGEPVRQSGKIAELSLQFQGGRVALQIMGRAYRIFLTDYQAETMKVAWRGDNPEIEGGWRGLNAAAIECMSRAIGETIEVWTLDKEFRRMFKTPLSFRRSRAALTMRVPGGDPIFYWTPRLRDRPTPWGTMQPAVIYRAEDSVTKQWKEFTGYGGLFCENAVQKTARNVMARGLVRLADAGLDPRLTVHDEGVCMVPRSRSNDPAALVSEILCQPEPWMTGLPVAADSSAGERYVKA